MARLPPGLAPRAAISALACCFVACAAQAPFQRPAPVESAGYAVAPAPVPAPAPAVSLGAGPPPRWWTAYQSGALDALVEQALRDNRGLRASNATLRRSEQRVLAMLGRTRPRADVSARAEREEVNLSAFGFDPAAFGFSGGNPQFNLYTLGGGVAYDLDFSGRHRRGLEQVEAEAEAQLRQTEAAHLTIAGRVVLQVFAIAALRDRSATMRALLDEDRRNLALTESRHRAGAGTLVEVLSARGQLASDEAVLPELEQQLAQARDLLAVLLGVSPAAIGATDYSLAQFSLPAEVPVLLPAALARQRPDILQAEAELHAASAALGVATAGLYPEVTLGADFSQAAPQAGELFSSRFRSFDIFAKLSAPLFRGGALRAAQRGAAAEAQAAAARYEQTVLEAFAQVSDLLAALGNDARGLQAQQRATEVAAESLRLSRRSFEVGYSDVLQVLDASRGYQRARLALVDAQARQFADLARLQLATAGSWMPAAAADPATQVR